MSSAADVELFSLETLRDPYPAYQKLRAEAPVFFVPEMNVHVITRYDLVRQAIKETDVYSSRYDGFLQESQRIAFAAASPEVQQQLINLTGQMVDVPPTMLTLDEPDHTNYRSLVNKLFVAARIREAQDAVQGVIDGCAASLLAAGSGAVDFVDTFAGPVPLQIIADRLGIPEEEREFFDDAATAAASALRLTPLPGEEMVRRAQLALDLQKLLIRLVDARREEPRADMISILANNKLEIGDRPLTHGECISVLNQFLVAGHETTASAFSWGMLLLCENPELQEQIRGDDKRIKTFVEETLRMEAPVQGLPRLVTKDTELGGYPLSAGDMVMLRYGAANRDGDQFPSPDEVDVDRAKAGQQLAFGAGVHFCIGAPLARQELTLGFRTLMDIGANWRLAEGAPRPEPEPSFILRNLPGLQVQFDPR